MNKQGRDLYIIECEGTNLIKIGRTNNPKLRLANLQSGCPYRLSILVVLKGEGHREKEIHKHLSPFLHDREWFKKEGLKYIPLSLKL